MGSATFLGLWLAAVSSIGIESPPRVAPAATTRITFEWWCDWGLFPLAVVVERSPSGATVETKIRERELGSMRSLLDGVALSKKVPLSLEVADQVEAAVRRVLLQPRQPKGAMGTEDGRHIGVSMCVGNDTLKGAADENFEDYGCIALLDRLIDGEFLRKIIDTYYRRSDEERTRPRSK